MRQDDSVAPDLSALLAPGSIAIIGASADRGKNSGKPLNFLLEHGYQGRIFPINPKYPELLGLECYPSLGDVPEKVDMAIIAVPAEHVAAALEDCSAKGVGGAVILSSGFAELGAEGIEEERRLISIARKGGVRLCGPNSVGLVVPRTGVVASFSQAADGQRLNSGGMALVSQSGNFGTFMVELAARRHIAFSHFVSTGNEADLTFLDFAEYLVDDPDVDVIVGYIEGLRDAEKLLRLGKSAQRRKKPIVVIKVGGTSVAARAAASHTGAMVGNDQLYDAAFRQAGIIRVGDEEEALDVLPLIIGPRRPRGRSVAIVSISGGGATILSDACVKEGLDVPVFEEATQAALHQVVPAYGMVANPVDLTGQVLSGEGLLKHCIEQVLQDPQIDSVIVFLSLLQKRGDQIANEVLEACESSDKPVVVSWVAGPQEPVARLRKAGIAVTTAPSTACARALANAVRYAEWIGEAAARKPQDSAVASALEEQDGRLLSGLASRHVLSELGIAVSPHETAKTADEAVEVARRIGFPVCIKLEQPVLAHKTEADAVRLNLSSPSDVRKAADDVLAVGARLSPAQEPLLLVEKMAPAGTDMLLSLRRDPQFGPSLHIGLGGIHAEIYRDVATRILPVADDGLASMLEELRARPLLCGYRGAKPVDLGALVRAMELLAEAGTNRPDISLIEINPFRVGEAGKGGVALDALIYAGGLA